MKRSLLPLLLLLIVPTLACGPLAAARVTPTPTKTPRPVQALPPPPTPTALVVVLPTSTPTPTETPTPAPTPTPLPTETPTPEPTVTNTPPPPPPPTWTPAPPPPPTFTPAPVIPTEPPPPPGPDVWIEFPNGNEVDGGDEVRFRVVARSPHGIRSIAWGVITQRSQAELPVIGGDKDCGNANECVVEREEDVPDVFSGGTLVIGADVVDGQNNSRRELAEIYVR